MRKICIVTGGRAEYGILYPLIKKINKDKSLTLQLVATGMHLSSKFGLTYKEIEKEFYINKKIAIKLYNKKEDISKSMGIVQIKFSKVFKELKPDIIVLVGDRYEIFAVASVATVLNIPIAHIHGGELTLGAIDDIFRHCITKMSHIHFTSTKEYKNRVIQLGENPKYVFNVGSLGVENIQSLNLLTKKQLEKRLNFKFLEKNILITYHTQTISSISATKQIKILLNTLKELKHTLLIFTKANADEGGIQINKKIDKFVKNHKNMIVFTSMGQLNYFSALQFVDCVVGNSSSGILEVPSFEIPTINIGDRQKGRIYSTSILNCPLEKKQILKTISNSYKQNFLDIQSPYENKNCSNNIIKVLKNTKLDNIITKEFYNLKVSNG